jgi:hypothetical protein
LRPILESDKIAQTVVISKTRKQQVFLPDTVFLNISTGTLGDKREPKFLAIDKQVNDGYSVDRELSTIHVARRNVILTPACHLKIAS